MIYRSPSHDDIDSIALSAQQDQSNPNLTLPDFLRSFEELAKRQLTVQEKYLNSKLSNRRALDKFCMYALETF
jgi:hypothetical protein